MSEPTNEYEAWHGTLHQRDDLLPVERREKLDAGRWGKLGPDATQTPSLNPQTPTLAHALGQVLRLAAANITTAEDIHAIRRFAEFVDDVTAVQLRFGESSLSAVEFAQSAIAVLIDNLAEEDDHA